MTEGKSALERMMGTEYTSDPRLARHSLPGGDLPSVLAGEASIPVGRWRITKEIAYDVVTNRIFRSDAIPRDLHDPEQVNRDPSTHEVEKLVKEELLPGNWDQFTPEGAYFTKSGHVLDGQHRFIGFYLAFLYAARQGIELPPFSIPVTVNVPWASYDKIDTGLKRKAHQNLVGYSDKPRAGMTLKFLSPMLTGRERLTLFDERLGPKEMRFLETLFPEMRATSEREDGWFAESELAHRRTGIPAKIILSHLLGARRSGAEYAHLQEFLNPLMNPDQELRPWDPQDRLRTYAWDVRNRRKRAGRTKLNRNDEIQYTNMMRHALKAYLEGRRLDKMTASDKGLAEIWRPAQLQQWYKEETA